MKESETWEVLVSLVGNEISLKQAHDKITRIIEQAVKDEKAQRKKNSITFVDLMKTFENLKK